MNTTAVKKNRRVLVAGAKFGEIYLNAFMQPQAGLELAGLYARGSRRAQQLAHAFGIPLWTRAEQIPDDIDIACVVIRSTVAGGEGSQLAAELLERGIHVLQEHPLHPDDIARLQKLAQQRNLLYWVNSFYPHLPACRCWIDKAQRVTALLDGERPVAAHLATSRQLLYSTLDLLLQTCGVTDAGQVTVATAGDANDGFTLVGLQLPGAGQATLHLQSWLDPADPDMFSLVMHQATLFWRSGYLTLAASHGPVVWTGAFHDAQHHNCDRTLYRYASEVDSYAQPTSVVLHPVESCWRDVFEVEAATAIGQILQSMSKVLAGSPVPAAFDSGYQLSLARLWLDIVQAVPAVTRQLTPPPLISCKALTDAIPTTGEANG
ncbi:Gfo/Idh/MocA family oxidoreductase [Erwinia psidii]|uniref:Thiazolinyl imide reductase n=1 Tax=Erwinia psidii TaxID=69224 RepID=A0A3N6S634_9GAMM|nr:Gfo/Idh/MocA family oxidoreductase [Erwinia psidii]MCX8963167.1 thiazolinyl imide reductase [Erwinia psidii]MCX8966954.1 thiazolinyl imide reductase [Erwinia psidii]RQM36480.1 thiazolinyl imide reductase [Erwinia psidii]